VSNEPHQQLANRTAFLYGRQKKNKKKQKDYNIANIAPCKVFVGRFPARSRPAAT